MKNPGFKFEYFSKTINYKGKYIETYAIGEGSNIILSFPSYPHSGISYLWFLNHYPNSLKKVKFITFDLPGWIGDSEDIFRNRIFEVEEYLRIADDVLDTYNVKKFSVLGYSYGASLAIKLNSEMPDRIKKVVIVSPVIDGPSSQFSNEAMIVNLVKTLQFPEALRWYINKQWHHYSPLLLKEGCPPSFINLYAGLVQQIDPKVLLDSIYGLFHLNWLDLLDKLNDKSCLVINSKNESRLYRKQAELLRRRLNNRKSLYLYGQHEDFLLHPQSTVVKQVVNFLTED